MIHYKIKDIRERKKLTVGFVASELQIAVATYIAVENGEVDIKLSKLYLIAEIFRVLPCDLFYCTETELTEKKRGNLHETAQVKGLFYSPFSDKVVEDYIAKLTEENRWLSLRLF
jgi:transcriptional regulator with XRE-family HTH domain